MESFFLIQKAKTCHIEFIQEFIKKESMGEEIFIITKAESRRSVIMSNTLSSDFPAYLESINSLEELEKIKKIF